MTQSVQPVSPFDQENYADRRNFHLIDFHG